MPAGRKVRAGERRRGLLGHLGTSRKQTGGRLVVQPRRLPESLDLGDVARFLSIFGRRGTGRWCWGCCSAGCGQRRSGRCGWPMSILVRAGPGGRQGRKERIVPVDSDFFAELNRYLREERPSGCSTPQCFVVLRGPTRGQPMGEAALRRIFRTHRDLAGAPGSAAPAAAHLRHRAGRRGHRFVGAARPDGPRQPGDHAGYVHLSIETLSAEYARARGSAALW